MLLELIAIAVVVGFVLVRLRGGFAEGFYAAVPLLIFLPTYLRITLPQPLPALTIQRILLLILLFAWMQHPRPPNDYPRTIFKSAFVFWSIAELLSTVLTSVTFVTSLKDYLDHVFEVVVFFFIASSIVRDGPSAIRMLKAVWIGLVWIAIFAVIEKYTGFNPVDRFISGYNREKGYGDVVSMLPQRIILGTAMAMGWPLGYALSQFGDSFPKRTRQLLLASGPLFLSCCYFSMSRGPWLAAVFVGLILMVWGTKPIRKKLAVILALVAIVLIARPGVLETFTGKAEQTVDTDSQKGGTAQYRMELWRIAWNQVSQSPLRTLVGYGLGAGREIELNWNLSYRGTSYSIESWDNHFAYALYQSGLVGLAAVMLLHCGAAYVLFRMRRYLDDSQRTFLVCCMASLAAMVFMMTNVLIFAKQLNFVFWSIFIAGVGMSGYYGPAFEASEPEVLEEESETVPTEEGLPVEPTTQGQGVHA